MQRVKRSAPLLVAITLILLTGCASLGGGSDVKSTVTELMEQAEATEIGSIRYDPDRITITHVVDGTVHELHERDESEIGEAETNPKARAYVALDDLPIDDFEARIAEAEGTCEDGADGELVSTVEGAILMTVGCREDDGRAASTWLDGEPVPSFDDWNSVEAVQAVLDESVAMLGPNIRFIGFGNDAEGVSETNTALVESAGVAMPDGTFCGQMLSRYLNAGVATEDGPPATVRYGNCAEVTDGAEGSGDISTVSADRVIATVESVTAPSDVGAFTLRFDHELGTWTVAVRDLMGDLIMDAPLV